MQYIYLLHTWRYFTLIYFVTYIIWNMG